MGNHSRYSGLQQNNRWFDLSLQPLPNSVHLQIPIPAPPAPSLLLVQVQAPSDQQPPQRTKVLALTASPFEETRTNAIAIGCDDFLRKPMQADLLLAKLAKHLSVTYRYHAPAPSAEASPDLLSPQALALLLRDRPPELVQQLHQLAVKGADRPMLELLAQLPTSYSPLIKTLTHWLEDFNFDKIVQLTRPKP